MRGFFSAEKTWRPGLSACTRNIMSSHCWRHLRSMKKWNQYVLGKSLRMTDPDLAVGFPTHEGSRSQAKPRFLLLASPSIPPDKCCVYITRVSQSVPVCQLHCLPCEAVHPHLKPDSQNPTWAEAETLVRAAAQMEHIMRISHHTANYRSRGQHTVWHWSFWPFSHDPCLHMS